MILISFPMSCCFFKFNARIAATFACGIFLLVMGLQCNVLCPFLFELGHRQNAEKVKLRTHIKRRLVKQVSDIL